MTRNCLRARIGLVLLLLAGSSAAAPALDEVLDGLERVKLVRDVACSPDGRWVAWSEKVRGEDGSETNGRLYVASAAAGTRRVTMAKAPAVAREQGAAFSPDSKELAFLSDATSPGQLQIYVASAEAGLPRRVTNVKGQLDMPRWSPDGKQIAFLYVNGGTQEVGALVAHKPDAGLVELKGEVQRLALVEVATGSVRELGTPELFVYDFDWSPDGRFLAAEAVQGSGTNDYWIAQLYRVEADSGTARVLWKPPLQLAWPRVSPDGRSVAVIHGLMSDEGSNGGDVWLVPAEGGAARNLTPGLPASPKQIAWRSADELLLAESKDGGQALESLKLATGQLTTLWKGAETITPFAAASAAPTSVVVRHSFEHPPEIWAGPIGAWKQLTRVNAEVKPFWGAAQSLHWPNDGAQVQGHLLAPPRIEPGKRYPLIVVVHGGPAGAHGAGWPSRWVGVLPSQDYFVLMPNPRGSFGFGAAFTEGNVKDFGYGDLRDILLGIDAAAAAAPIDTARVGLAGWSYGGYMAMWAPTQTQRFKAAVAGAGIASWQSYYGQNRIDRWMLPYFGQSVYDDPWIYARSSPITFAKQVKTPTLVLHGERDSEVPAPQGYEWWHALRTLGVTSELVIYPNEGHGVQKPEHQRDIQKRSVAWFDRFLK